MGNQQAMEPSTSEGRIGTSSATTTDINRGRTAACAIIKATQFMKHTDPLFMHGRSYTGPQEEPKVTWLCTKPPRDDHEAPTWLTATEFEDTPRALRAKCAALAALMKLSRKTVLYTGAGISASVIGLAARSGTFKQGWVRNKGPPEPTFTHLALGFLGRQGLVHEWVQQNHDGLPQKGGFPQESINEIHGSWFDPSNPVVKYNGSLHERAFPWMKEVAGTADLVLVLGTSLGGLTADQVATNAAERSRSGTSLGACMINLQQTVQDGKMTLRVFGKSDDVLRVLLNELDLSPMPDLRPVWPVKSVALVPYDRGGKRLARSRRGKGWEGPLMWLDLRPGTKVRVSPGHNIQGAKQPLFLHIGQEVGKRKPITYKNVKRRPGVGRGTVTKREKYYFHCQIEGVRMRLGIWWLESAIRGGVTHLPIVNIDPRFDTGAAARDGEATGHAGAATAVDVGTGAFEPQMDSDGADKLMEGQWNGN